MGAQSPPPHPPLWTTQVFVPRIPEMEKQTGVFEEAAMVGGPCGDECADLVWPRFPSFQKQVHHLVQPGNKLFSEGERV